jgi:pimeloyl-ACP methyl ester carboxylesterase
MRKKDLVIVHSFYANSILLSGLIEYLSGYFNVYFIDLPGFAKSSPPLTQVTLASYSQYVREKLQELALDNYLICGISFGFSIISNMEHDHNCQGIVAIFPYINSKCLKLKPLKKAFYSMIVNIMSSSNLPQKIWGTDSFRRFAHFYSRYPKERVDIIIDEMDGTTFFQAGKLILHNHLPCPFHDVPYVLVINENDNTIHYEYVLESFRRNVENLFIMNTSLEHYPETLTKDYFRLHFTENNINSILQFIQTSSSPKSPV